MRYLLVIFILIKVSSLGFSQSLTNNGATISIKENTTFSVGENATNNGTIINNGDFLISGAWVNNGTYNAGIGQFTLNSSGEQIVNHNDQSFDRLVIRGGGTKVFQADITVIENLDLQDGVLVSQNGAKMVISENAQITGGSETAYIAGPLFLYTTGTTFYPIGTIDTYLPVTLESSDDIGSLVGLAALSPNPISSFNIKQSDEIAANLAWQLELSSGSLSNTTITLPTDNASFIQNIENTVIMQAANSNSPYTSLGLSTYSGTASQGTVTSETPVSGTIFTLGYLTNGSESLTSLSEIEVVNAVTPATQDGRHDFLRIINIEEFPANSVNIYNRRGDLVFEMNGYNNQDRIFVGNSNVNGTRELDDGTYFYAIEAGGEVKTGFFVLRR